MLGGNLVAAAPASAAQANCTVAALSALHIHNITITSATDVPASGSNPEYCDVHGAVATGGEGFGHTLRISPKNTERIHSKETAETDKPGAGGVRRRTSTLRGFRNSRIRYNGSGSA
jgi:hypothetical protein